MPRFYLDTSALVKHYHQESGSPKVDALFSVAANRFFISRLALVEASSSFARLVREQVLSESDFRALEARIHADILARTLLVAAATSRRMEEAAQLLGTHGLTHNVRTLDAIHLATANILNSRQPLAGFVAADQKLLQTAAAACGLPVVDVS